MKQEPTRWEATTTPGLYIRQPGGGFYARITLNGKRSWRSLKTDKLRKAQGLLRDLQSGHTRQVSTRSDDKLHAAMDAVIEFRGIRRALKSKQLRKSTTAYHGEILASAKKLLPDRPLATFDTVGLLKAIQGCGLSQSRRKAIFELLKRTFATAVENGVIQKNPLAGHIPGKVERKERTLPTREQLDEMMRVIPELFPRYGHRAVLTLRFLAFSGMRLSEARSVTWDDIADGKIRIRGGEEGLKTKDAGQSRLLDISPPLQSVLDDIQPLSGALVTHIVETCKKNLQTIDHHTIDVLLGAGWDTTAADAPKNSADFETYLREHKDELIALTIYYDQPQRRQEVTFAQIKEVLDHLKAHAPQLAPLNVWQAYARLDGVPATATPLSELTALVALTVGALPIRHNRNRSRRSSTPR